MKDAEMNEQDACSALFTVIGIAWDSLSGFENISTGILVLIQTTVSRNGVSSYKLLRLRMRRSPNGMFPCQDNKAAIKKF
jgi:hypothetical protein